MIITTDRAIAYLGATDVDTNELEEELLALEFSIRKITNNNFIKPNFTFYGVIQDNQIITDTRFFKEEETVQISNSTYNAGIYNITSKSDALITVDKELYDEPNVRVHKVEYPVDVQKGVLEILRWKYKNAKQNYDPNAEKEIQSETLSRHSVTYAQDTTEADLDPEFGVPKKYTAFLKRYMKARF